MTLSGSSGDKPSAVQRMVGSIEVDEAGRRWLVPFDPRVEIDIEVLDAEALAGGVYAVVDVVPNPRPRRPARGRVVEVLGRPETPGVDTTILVRHAGIPEGFPEDALREAAALPPDPGPADWQGREDLRRERVVTIDGETARDFDDAISLARAADGGFRLGVHIADVAHYVTAGNALDRAARERGTSVYFPDRAVPMLPEELSSGLCSLRPDVPRLTMSVFLDLDASGTVRAKRFAETVIQSRRRLTYTEVRRVLEEPQDSDAARYGEVLPLLADMAELMRALYRRREERGSIDFDLPTGDLVLDDEGHTIDIRASERNVAHRIIEELMIAANEAVAGETEARGAPSLYRVHDPPPAPALAELGEVLRPMGIEFDEALAAHSPAALQAVLAQSAGRPEDGFVSTLVLRSVARALYSPECRGHYALGAPAYTHFTSPIRRYPDLVVHRALKALLRAGETEAPAAAELPELAEQTSTLERRAEQAERDLLQWRKVRFLAERVGETFHGRVTGVTAFGCFVQLDEYFVDGLLPIRELGDDYYVFEPEAHRLVGSRTGRVFQLAQEIEVLLAGVSERHRGLDFRLAEALPPRRQRYKAAAGRGKGADRGRGPGAKAGRGKRPSGRRPPGRGRG